MRTPLLLEDKGRYALLRYREHRGWGSFVPALIALLLCWITRRPLEGLAAGVLSGLLLLGPKGFQDELLPSLLEMPQLGTLLLSLACLGGLLGLWTKTDSPGAWARWLGRWIRSRRGAKLSTWGLGILCFQGGSLSTILVGTAARPLADREGVSHEEIAYIVDSTASPVSALIALNAWPGYIQGFLLVAGVPFLAESSDRLRFFYQSIPFFFYAILAILGTFLLCLDKSPFLGKAMREAIRRSREDGLLDAKDAAPLGSNALFLVSLPPGYLPSAREFLLPLIALLAIAGGTALLSGLPQILPAFAGAFGLALGMAFSKGMSLADLWDGAKQGFRGIAFGLALLILAALLGLSLRSLGGGLALMDTLQTALPFWLLPLFLQAFAVLLSFATGTSWGTFAVVLPLAMPLAWGLAEIQALSSPFLFFILCFSAVVDGALYGDQCSPVSDTTILSSMCTGCDLLDHVRTQIPQATAAAALAAALRLAILPFAA